MIQISDAELDAYYAGIYENANGYDPMEGPYSDEADSDQFDPEWDGWVKESEREW